MDKQFKKAWEDDLYPALMIIARKDLPLEAEDVVQETLEAVLLSMEKGTQIENIKGYASKTLKYKIYRRWEKKKKINSPVELPQDLPNPDKNAEESIEYKEMRHKIWQALEALSPECRKMIELHELDGKTFSEMTAYFPQSRAAIHFRYKKCLAAFEKEFKKYWDI